MIAIPFFNLVSTRPCKILGITELKCSVIKIDEMQGYQLPSQKLDSLTFINDTIWKDLKAVNIEVLVDNKNIAEFEASINATQFSTTMFTVESINNKVYSNLKIIDYKYISDNTAASHTRYFLSCQEFLLVDALATTYKDVSKPSYSKNNQVGTKNTTPTPPQEKNSALKGWIR